MKSKKWKEIFLLVSAWILLSALVLSAQHYGKVMRETSQFSHAEAAQYLEKEIGHEAKVLYSKGLFGEEELCIEVDGLYFVYESSDGKVLQKDVKNVYQGIVRDPGSIETFKTERIPVEEIIDEFKILGYGVEMKQSDSEGSMISITAQDGKMTFFFPYTDENGKLFVFEKSVKDTYEFFGGK